MLTERFADAAAWAATIHNDHVRKGNNIPYVSHLFAVASLVLEDGGNEDEAIGALLHDAVEDNKTTIAEVRARYGDTVAGIVAACSDTDSAEDEFVTEKKPWRQRKEHYITHLLDDATTPSALRVSNADKVHNARCILADYRRIGDELWTRFNKDAANAEAQLWYYGLLADAFLARRPESPLAKELDELVRHLRNLAVPS